MTLGKLAGLERIKIQDELKDKEALIKELRDILWPNDCVVVSFDRLEHHKEQAEIAAGDVLTVRYKTFNPAETAKEFEVLVGTQAENVKRIMVPTSV